MRGEGPSIPKSLSIGCLGALLLAFSAPTSAAAQPGAASDWPSTPHSKASGRFAVAQIATIDADQFMDEWRKPTPGVRLKTSTRTRRNQPIFTFITFRGCHADAAGKCNVTVTYDVSAPSGKTYAHSTMDVWASQPQPPKDYIQLSRQGFGLVFDQKDGLGSYIVRATTTDHVAGISVQTQQELVVSD